MVQNDPECFVPVVGQNPAAPPDTMYQCQTLIGALEEHNVQVKLEK